MTTEELTRELKKLQELVRRHSHDEIETLGLNMRGTAAPTTTPPRVGVIFCDTTNGKVYISTGVSSSSDWKLLN